MITLIDAIITLIDAIITRIDAILTLINALLTLFHPLLVGYSPLLTHRGGQPHVRDKPALPRHAPGEMVTPAGGEMRCIDCLIT